MREGSRTLTGQGVSQNCRLDTKAGGQLLAPPVCTVSAFLFAFRNCRIPWINTVTRQFLDRCRQRLGRIQAVLIPYRVFSSGANPPYSECEVVCRLAEEAGVRNDSSDAGVMTQVMASAFGG